MARRSTPDRFRSGAGQVVKFFSVDQVGNRERVRVYGPMVQQVQLVLTGMTGATATFIAAARAEAAATRYMFNLRDPQGRWSLVRFYGPDGTWIWDKSSVSEGRYTVQVLCVYDGRVRRVPIARRPWTCCFRPQAAPVLINPGDQFNDDGARTYAEAVLADAPGPTGPLGEPSGAVAIDGTGFAAATRFGAIAGAQPGSAVRRQ